MIHSRFFFVVAALTLALLVGISDGLEGVKKSAEVADVGVKSPHHALTNDGNARRSIRRLENIPASKDDTGTAVEEEERLIPVLSELKSLFRKSPNSAISFEKNSTALKTLEQHPELVAKAEKLSTNQAFSDRVKKTSSFGKLKKMFTGKPVTLTDQNVRHIGSTVARGSGMSLRGRIYSSGVGIVVVLAIAGIILAMYH